MKNGNLKIKTFGSTLLSAQGFFLVSFAIFSIFHFSHSTVSAQPDSVPPPPKVIEKAEKVKLEAVTDEKDRTILALSLMDEHLKQAEKYFAAEDLTNLYVELGAFHYHMDNALDYLLRRNTGSSKMRNNLKRYEIGLRGFAPRLELIRREVQPRYEPYIFGLLKQLRDARSKAVDPQFGNTVVPS